MGKANLASAITLSILWLAGPAIAAPVPGLLTPVSKSTEAKLNSKKNYWLRDQLYFAKRYRFVEIDYELLDIPNAEFTITPFPDVPIRVKTIHTVDPSSAEGYRIWTGELSTDDSTEKFAVSLFIRNEPVTIPQKLAVKLKNEGKAVGISQVGDPTLRVKTVSGVIHPASGVRYQLQPVGDDPRHHVIYEEDSSKLAKGAENLDQESIDSGRRYDDFREALKREEAADPEANPQ